MTDEDIRNLSVQYARDIATSPATIIPARDKFELLDLANDIFAFIKSGTVPTAP